MEHLVNAPRFVLGVDPLLSSVSICRFAEGVEHPVPHLITNTGLPAGDRSLVAEVGRISGIADAVMEKVLHRGKPTLVAISTPNVGRTDSSGPRRAALVGEVERRLVAAKIPTIEVETDTLAKWLLRRVPRRSFEPLEKAIVESWHPENWKPDDDTSPGWEELVADGYRISTVALAAAAAVVAGIGTRRPVGNADLAVFGEKVRPRLPLGWAFPVNEKYWPGQCGMQTETEEVA